MIARWTPRWTRPGAPDSVRVLDSSVQGLDGWWPRAGSVRRVVGDRSPGPAGRDALRSAPFAWESRRRGRRAPRFRHTVCFHFSPLKAATSDGARPSQDKHEN